MTFNIKRARNMFFSSNRPTTSVLLRTSLLFGCGAAIVTATQAASANPRPLPYTYPYETLSAESAEIEQYIDLTPVRVADPGGGAPIWDQAYQLQTEFEYGITDRLELGLYMVFKNDPGGPLGFDGIKQRLRYRFADEGEWPVDVGLYGEVAEFHDELEFEQKLILSKRFDKIRVMANFWFEQSLEHYEGEVEAKFRPVGGVTGEITPNFHVGAEYWGIARFENEAAPGTIDHFNGSFQHYVGPAVSLQFGKLWWSTGAYLRLNEMKRTSEVGDEFGHAWVRTVIAVSL